MPRNPYNTPFFNDSGEAIPPFAVMRPIDVVERAGEWTLSMAKPDATFRRRYYVNGATSVPVGGRSVAADGTIPCVVKASDAIGGYDEGFGVISGSWELARHGVGSFSAIQGSSTGFGLFTQEDCDHLIVSLNDNLIAGGSASATILFGTPPAVIGSGIILPTVWDAEMDTGTGLPAETRCGITWRTGAWYVDWYSTCPVPEAELPSEEE